MDIRQICRYNLEKQRLFYEKSKEEMRPSDSYAISAIMVRIEGWEKCGARQMLPIYGRQRVYTRTT